MYLRKHIFFVCQLWNNAFSFKWGIAWKWKVKTLAQNKIGNGRRNKLAQKTQRTSWHWQQTYNVVAGALAVRRAALITYEYVCPCPHTPTTLYQPHPSQSVKAHTVHCKLFNKTTQLVNTIILWSNLFVSKWSRWLEFG